MLYCIVLFIVIIVVVVVVVVVIKVFLASSDIFLLYNGAGLSVIVLLSSYMYVS